MPTFHYITRTANVSNTKRLLSNLKRLLRSLFFLLSKLIKYSYFSVSVDEKNIPLPLQTFQVVTTDLTTTLTTFYHKFMRFCDTLRYFILFPFRLQILENPMFSLAFPSPTSPRRPGRYKTSDNTTHPSSRESDGRVPGCGIRSGGGACGLRGPPGRWFQ